MVILYCLINILIKIHLIATGTGIAPFRSMVKSYSNLNLVIQVVKKENELYYKNDLNDYTSCISQENKGNFQGRVTDIKKKN